MARKQESKTQAPAPDRPPRKLSRRKLWAFRVAAMLLPLVVLGVLELFLRLTGLGPDVRLIQTLPGNPAGLTHQVNGAVDLAYYGAADLLGPEPRQFALPKPKQTFRIVFLGESTVIGFPYASDVAFPRHAEIQLEQQNPDLQVEVFNLGVTAINSFAIVDLLEQCLACDPDLIVVHAGHNEFYGPGGPASTAGRVPHSLINLLFRLRRSRVLQLVESLNPLRRPLDDDLLDTLPRTLEIPRGGRIYQQAAENFRQNLKRMTNIAAENQIPLMVSTVASNLRNQGPLRSIEPTTLAPPERVHWEKLLERGEALLQQAQHADALEAFVEAEALFDGHARLTYRKAQCLEALDRPTEALAAYQQARDDDACRFRAPSAFSTIAREVAETADGIVFLDVEQRVNAESSPSGPGDELFLEHVHYTFDGHVRLGRMFARSIQEEVLKRPWSEDAEPSRNRLESLLGVVPEDHLAAYSSAIEVLQTGPLKSALDASRNQEHLAKLISESYYTMEPNRREAFADLPMNVMVNDLIGGLAIVHHIRGNQHLSQRFWELASIRRPWTAATSGQ